MIARTGCCVRWAMGGVVTVMVGCSSSPADTTGSSGDSGTGSRDSAVMSDGNGSGAAADAGSDVTAPGNAPSMALWDTAWTLNLSSESTVRAYLSARKSQGFDVVMMGYGGFGTSNAALGNGETPFLGTLSIPSSDPVADVMQPNEAGWGFVDATIDYANAQGLTTCLLPLGNGSVERYVDALTDQSSGEQRAYKYGQWLGNRYKGAPRLIWMLGGDVDESDNAAIALTDDIARGIRSTGDAHPITFEPGSGPTGAASSSTWFNGESWLTFNAIQARPLALSLISSDLALSPNKPTGVAETYYETSSYGSGASSGQLLADIWQGYLTGASYVAYGQAGMYQGENPARTDGIVYSRIARDEVSSRGWLDYTPTQDYISASSGLVTATRKGSSAAMIYLGDGATVEVTMAQLNATGSVRVQRFDPRQNTAVVIGSFPASGRQTFTGGNLTDAVLLFDAD